MADRTLATRRTDAVVPRFRGAQDLETRLARFEEQAVKNRDHVAKACEAEIAALSAAQKEFEKKLRTVLKSKEMEQMEESLSAAQDKLTQSMRGIEREMRRMSDKIEDDVTLSEKQKSARLQQLQEAASAAFTKLAEKYPTAVRAQMVGRVQLLM